MIDLVEAVGGPHARVLDLACGTGSITERLLARLPGASSVGVDLDLALLAIAEGHFAGDGRFTLVTADLRDPDWAAALPEGPFDAVVTATALHWLATDDLLRLYRDLAGLLRPGGVFLNADHCPQPATPRLNELVRTAEQRRQQAESAAGVLSWAEWWQAAAADPRLAEAVAARSAVYRDHKDGDVHTTEWQLEQLIAAGFGEAGLAWRSVTDAMTAAVR
ncbi:class I SAM-dependent methyltransferase [Kitasatospora viridis]